MWNFAITFTQTLLLTILLQTAFSTSGQAQNCNAGFAYNDSLNIFAFMDTSSSTMTISSWLWDFGDGGFSSVQHPIHIYANPGTYIVKLIIADSTCTDSAITFVSIAQNIFVWPGDADFSGVAQAKDILYIGLAFGAQGFPRLFGNDTVWDPPQPALDWTGTFSAGHNYKHADCNGDGLIDADDVNAILFNYSKIRGKTSSSVDTCDLGNPPLYFKTSKDTIKAGDTVKIDIMFGDEIDTARNIYGLVFSIGYNPEVVDSGSVSMTFTDSWLGNQSNTITIQKDLYDLGQMDVGLSRTDGQDVSDLGKIGDMIIVMEDNIIGQALLELEFKGEAIGISYNQMTVDICEQNDSIYISSVLPKHQTQPQEINIYPNPTKNTVTIVPSTKDQYDIVVSNLLGQDVIVKNGLKNKTTLNVEDIPEGIYLITINSAEGLSTRKLRIIR